MRSSWRSDERTADGSAPVVLVAHPSADTYGSDRQLVESVAGLVARGWRVRVHLPTAGPLVEMLRSLGVVEVVTAGAVPVLRKSLRDPIALARFAGLSAVALVRLVRLLRTGRPDLVYVNTVTIPVWTVAARLARVPVLVHVHEAEEMSSAVVRRALYAPLLLASTVIANSSTTERVLLTSHSRLRSRVVVIANGLPDRTPVPYGDSEDGLIVVVSRLSPRKGVHLALEAVALLRATGRNVRLEIDGTCFPGYEWYESELRDRAGQLDLAGAVTFAGYVDGVDASLARARVVLAPSFGESFGNSAVEAMLAARPLVASAVQGLAEIVHDGRTGLLVAPGDPDAIAAAVARLLDDPAWAQRLALDARRDALERFGADRYRSAVEQVAATVVRRDRSA